MRAKRFCATATGPQIGPPPRLFRAEARENAERGQSFGEYLEVFDHFYADDIEGTTDTMKEPVHSKAVVRTRLAGNILWIMKCIMYRKATGFRRPRCFASHFWCP